MKYVKFEKISFDKDTIETCYMNEEDGQYMPYYNVIKWFPGVMRIEHCRPRHPQGEEEHDKKATLDFK